jgi:hypothetical protein
VFSSARKVAAGHPIIHNAEELAVTVHEWSIARMVEVWNQLPAASASEGSPTARPDCDDCGRQCKPS